MGLICPSTSPEAAGFFFVQKKDGTLRLQRSQQPGHKKTVPVTTHFLCFWFATGSNSFYKVGSTECLSLGSDPWWGYIFSRSLEEHVTHVQTVLHWLLQHSLYVKPRSVNSTPTLPHSWGSLWGKEVSRWILRRSLQSGPGRSRDP